MHASEHDTASALPGSGQAHHAAGVPLDLDQIQGNVIGFLKDHQTFLFLRFPDNRQAEVRRWLRSLVPQVSTAAEVLAFNTGYKALHNQQRGLERTIAATWLNVAFTYAGLAALDTLSLDGFPEDFREGMRKRAMDDKLGDTDDSAPANWVYPKDGEPIHALLLLAADNPDDLKAEAGRQVTALRKAGIELVYKQDGMVRPDQRGHEHFGFKDGVSQPGIRDDRVTPRKLSDRQAGQDRIWPGEFIIGYPRQSVPSEEEEATDRGDGEEEEEGPGGPIVEPTPDWTMNGSYLVFRRLRQDVRGFRDFVRQQAAALGLGVDLMGAKLVGRYASGAPLAALKNPANGANQIGPGRQDDPGRIDPDSDLLKSEHINDFEFAELDNLGELVPRGAHIRKVYPRDQKTKHQPGADVKRILRRGIPFGSSYREENADKEPKGGPAFPEDRGLLFICYQNSIADKFEFLQQTWVNDRDFPSPVAQGGPRPGQDPIIAQRDGEREFDIPGVRKSHIKLMERWVTTTGGDYFFSPSIQALRTLA